MKKLIMLSCLTLAACGASEKPPAGPAGPSPAPEPSAACQEAVEKVAEAYGSSDGIYDVHHAFLAGDRCAVSITLGWQPAYEKGLDIFRAAYGQYSYVPVVSGGGEERIPVWFNEPRVMFLPILDRDGNRIDDTETHAECEQAAAWVKEAFPQSVPLVITYQEPWRRGCRVDAHFFDDAQFRSIFAWNNPHSKFGEKLMMHFERESGVTATVVIRPARAGDPEPN